MQLKSEIFFKNSTHVSHCAAVLDWLIALFPKERVHYLDLHLSILLFINEDIMFSHAFDLIALLPQKGKSFHDITHHLRQYLIAQWHVICMQVLQVR